MEFHWDRIRLDLKAGTGVEAIDGLVGELALVGGCREGCGSARREVLAREEITSTALDAGVALPHARATAVDRIVTAVGRSREGVNFPGCAAPVWLVVLIATPPEMVREYLGLVAGLLRSVRSAGGLDELMNAGTEEEFVRRLGGGQ